MSLATLSNTKTMSIHSKYVGDHFDISIAFPKDYDKTNKKYPIIYVLDANIFFGLFVQTARLLQYGAEIPDTVIVGIGYPKDHMILRNRDFGPTPYNLPEVAGHSDKFLAFLNLELKPMIESQFRVTDDTTLAGDSMSGLFALYTLFHQPETFDRYIIGSPSMYWDDNITFKYENDYYTKEKDLKAKVFMSAGTLEAIYEPEFAAMVGNVEKLNRILTLRAYKGLELTCHIFENETHLSVIPATMSRGLRSVFESKELIKD